MTALVHRHSQRLPADAFRGTILADPEIKALDFLHMEAKRIQNTAKTGLAGVLDNPVDCAVIIVTQGRVGGPMNIRFNDGAVAADVSVLYRSRPLPITASQKSRLYVMNNLQK